jgi:tyrosine-specific transport protein
MSSPSGTYAGQHADPVQALQFANPVAAPLIEAFSFMAIVTSFIGFVLGLSEFWQDVLPLPSSKSRAPAYALTLVPPYFLALAFPDIFFAALDKVIVHAAMLALRVHMLRSST